MFLVRLNESSGKAIVVTLASASASASGLDVLVNFFIKTHFSFTSERILLILALEFDKWVQSLTEYHPDLAQ